MSEFNYVMDFTYGGSDESSNSSDTLKSEVSQRLGQINNDRLRLQIEEGLLIEKGMMSDDPDLIIKASKQWEDVQNRESSGLKSDLVDPNAITYSVGYKYKAASLSYDILRKMSRTPIIRAIIGTRQAQVSAFSHPQREKYDTGFIIRKKREHYNTDEPKLTKADKLEQQRITNFLLNCGENENKWHGDTFDQFLKKLTEDSLSLDQGTFEVARNRIGLPVEFAATDGATMRIGDSIDDDAYHNRDKIEKYGYLPSYVQVIDGQIHNEYYPWELCFGIRNASTDIHSNGYGRSELEDLINIVTWMLFGDEYNGRFFSQGSSPKGLLKVSKGTNRSKIQEFRQQWMSMVAGVMNAWKVPIIESDKMEWVDLQKNNTDMQFAHWQEYLTKVSCAVYKIAPEEIGFHLGSETSAGGGAFGENGNEARLKYSKDKGLKPLLKSLQFWINKWIVNALNPEWEFVFAGLDTADEDAELERDIKAVSNFEGLKEVRVRRGLPAELDEGDVILNPQFMQKFQADQMAGEQAANDEAIEGMDPNEEFFEDGVDDEEVDYDYKDIWDNLDVNKSVIDDIKKGDNPFMEELITWFDEEIVGNEQ